ncbi:helix-turn-helix transcriptional regulator [Alicyclobacillus fastidiosus]|uniref:Helix-turn-helix transcriptional regulator n=2 Tax=Alicyclobacillus fastidiosus TaxID=392011 RepID=A0ABY6ZP69_9BACL|nr:helix-turn-helix transcriptional regulator [Alicyclobacillus fastidiosus]WAH44689.1 helix-turn-helix transcriptional regulator [Alicyclobacillus fastidiosus]
MSFNIYESVYRYYVSVRSYINVVRIHLSRLLGEKRMSQRRLAEATGLRPNTISELYNERAKRIDFATIDRLCQALDCQVSDLFEYIPQQDDVN